jgi:hypothetical protein
MKRIFVLVVFASLLVGSLVSCGSSRHAGKCDAYSLNNKVLNNQELASK